MTAFADKLAELRERATKGPWSREGHSRLVGVTLNGIQRTEDADFIAFLANHAEAIEKVARALEPFAKAYAIADEAGELGFWPDPEEVKRCKAAWDALNELEGKG